MQHHRTHTGELISGARLQAAQNKVADDWAALAHAIRADDFYASHVSDADKAANLARMLAEAERIRTTGADSFTIWQRINAELTGECVALLSQ